MARTDRFGPSTLACRPVKLMTLAVDGMDCRRSSIVETNRKPVGVPLAGGDGRLVEGSGSRRGEKRSVRYLEMELLGLSD